MHIFSRINRLLTKMRDNSKLQHATLFSIISLMFLYTFSIPSFSGRERIYLVSYALMALFAFVTIFYTLAYGKFSLHKRCLIPVLFILEAIVGTAIYSHDFRRWLSIFLMVITLFVYYFAFCAIKNSRLSLKIIVVSFLAFAIYFIYIYKYQIFHLLIDDRIGIYFDNQNAIGSYFSLAFTISMYLAIMSEKKTDLFYLIPSGVFGLCGIFTGSRTFIVLVIVSISVILFIRFKAKKWIFLIVYAGLILLFFIAVNLPIFATLKLRVDQTFYTLFGIGNSKIDHSSIQRVLWQRYGYYLGSNNLIFGYGCEGFAIYSGIGTYSHSNFSEVFCNFGIVGFALFYSCYLVPFLLCFVGNQKDRYVVFVFVIYFLVKSFFGVSYYYKESYLVIALCMYLTKETKILDLFKERKAFSGNFCEVCI